MTKGLILNVYQHPSGNFSAGGISERCTEVTLLGPGVDEVHTNNGIQYRPIPGVTLDGVFDVTPQRPAVRLVRRHIMGRVYVHCEPIDRPDRKGSPMYGGTLVTTSDSRFGQMLRAMGYDAPALCFHDRFEY